MKREELFKNLYLETFPAFSVYVKNHGGTLEDAREVFQEALLTYYEKCIIQNFIPETSASSYVYGIARNIWRGEIGSIREVALECLINPVSEDESIPITDRIMIFLETAGQKCMDMLQSFYYERLTMADIALRFGFKGERSATVQKYKCIEKVRTEIKKRALVYEDFFE